MTVLQSLPDSIQTNNTNNTSTSNSANLYDENNQFSKVLESTGKSYDLSYEIVNDESYNSTQNNNYSISYAQQELGETFASSSNALKEEVKGTVNDLKSNTEKYYQEETQVRNKSSQTETESTIASSDSSNGTKESISNKETKNSDESQESDEIQESVVHKEVKDDAKSDETKEASNDNDKLESKIEKVENPNEKNSQEIGSTQTNPVEKVKSEMEEALKQVSNVDNNLQVDTSQIPNELKKADTNVLKKEASLDQQILNAKSQTNSESLLGNKNTEAKQIAQDSSSQSTVKKQTINVEIEASRLEELKASGGINTDVKDQKAINQEMTNDLKPRIEKVEINQQQNALHNQNQSQNQQQNNEQKADININQSKFQLNGMENNVDNTIAKLNFENQLQATLKTNITNQPQNLNNLNVIKQVQDQIMDQANENKSSLTMTLRPASLGKLNIDIVSQQNGVTAQITTESQQTKDILTKGIESLRQNLHEQGLQVQNISIKVEAPEETNKQNFNFNQNTPFDNMQGDMSDSRNSKHTSEKNIKGHDEVTYDFDSEEEEITNNGKEIAQTNPNGNIDYRA